MATKTAAKPIGQTRKKRKPRWLRWLQGTFVIGFFLLVLASGLAYWKWIGLMQQAAQEVPKLSSVKLALDIGPSVIKSADGKVLYTMLGENREWVRLGDIPKVIQDATIAAEDKRFYQHSGVDVISVARQVFTNVKDKRISGGASTLTMQLAKRLFTGTEKSIERKMLDMALAVQIERSYSKEYILEMYLNQVYYGSWAYGIKKAAEVYFNKPLDKITLSEAAILARCVRRPSDENPFADPQASLENRNAVLEVMVEEGLISRAKYEKARAEKLRVSRQKPKPGGNGVKQHPYFVDYVLDTLHHLMPDVDVTHGGYTIETTLDTRMQDISDDQVQKFVRRYRGSGIRAGAFLLTNKDGEIRAMTGGLDYERNQFNMVTQGRRQPGSSFKPFVYSLALEYGVIGPDSYLSNEKTIFRVPGDRPYAPGNSNGKYGGSVSVRTALAYSMNIPAVNVAYKYSKERSLRDLSRRAESTFGFRNEIRPLLSTVLGTSEVSPLEMAQGYSVFMLSGSRFTPFCIRRIIGPDGTEVANYTPNIKRGMMRADIADLMDSYLRAVVTSGTARIAQSVTNARGKTGTTQDARDAWFVGYSDELLGVGWIANEQRVNGRWVYLPMSSSVFGGTHTCSMWTSIMSRCQQITKEKASSHRAPEIDVPEGARDVVAPPDDGMPDPPVNDDGSDPTIVQPSEPPDTGPQVDPSTGGGNGDSSDPSVSDPPAAPENREPTRRPQPPADSRPLRDSGTVTVLVCADSGLLAKDGCPERISRTYRKGREPKRRCNQH